MGSLTASQQQRQPWTWDPNSCFPVVGEGGETGRCNEAKKAARSWENADGGYVGVLCQFFQNKMLEGPSTMKPPGRGQGLLSTGH